MCVCVCLCVDSDTSSGPEEVAVSSEPAALMSDVQKALGADKSKQLFSCLSAYRKNQQYDQMVTSVVSLLTERDEHLKLLTRKPPVSCSSCVRVRVRVRVRARARACAYTCVCVW